MPALQFTAYIALTSFTLNALAMQLWPIRSWPLANLGFGLTNFQFGSKLSKPSPFRKLLTDTTGRDDSHESAAALDNEQTYNPDSTTYSDKLWNLAVSTSNNGDGINPIARKLNTDFEEAFSAPDWADLNATPDLTDEFDATLNWQPYFEHFPQTLDVETPLSAAEVYQAKRSRSRHYKRQGIIS